MTNPNKYAQQKVLHERCLAILNALEEFIRRLNSAEDHLNRFDAADKYAPIRLMNYRWKLEWRIEVLKHTVERMQGYYEKHQTRFCEFSRIVSVSLPRTVAIGPLPDNLKFHVENEYLTYLHSRPIDYGYEELNSHKPDTTNQNSCFHGTTDGTGPNSNVPGYC